MTDAIDNKKPPDKADHEHMAAMLAGSNTSWGTLFERYQAPLVRFCGNFTKDSEVAEEWAQETFIRLKEKAHTFQPGAALKPWLYKVARNVCLESLRKRKEIRWSDSVFAAKAMLLIDSGPAPSTLASNAEFSAKAREMLGQLSEEQRTVFLLKYVEDLSRQEIAEVMDVPENTVKSRLYYAMNALRGKLSRNPENKF